MRKRWTATSRLAAAAALASAVAFGSSDGLAVAEQKSPAHRRAAIFGGADSGRLVDHLSSRSRLHVFFHPEVGRCEPQQIAAIHSLRRLLGERSDIEVLTVVPAPPAGRPQVTSLFGEALPGKVVTLPGAAYLAEGRISPRPRLEVWSRKGELLLLRSIPPTATEEGIYGDVLWSLAFTGPVER